MLKRLSLYILFFTSYLPLFVILFLQNFKGFHNKKNELNDFSTILKENTVSIICLFISVLSLVLFIVLISSMKRYGFQTPEKVIKIKNTGVEYLTYLGTYIIPFIGIKFDSNYSSLSSWILILLIAIIYPKTNLVYANPTLAICNYYIYKVNLSSDPDEEVVVISKEKLKKNCSIRLKKLKEEVFFGI